MLPLLILAALSFAEPETAAVKGRLCWTGASAECVATAGTTIEVAPAEGARDYVWTSEQGSRVVLGRLEPTGKSIDVGSNELRVIQLSIGGDAARGWPHDAQLSVGLGKEERWRWTIAGGQASRLREIAVPAGDYALTISAPRHRVERRRISARQNVTLGAIALKPLPSVSGRLVEVDGEKRLPVIGAQILSGEGDVEGNSGTDGAFRVELEEPLPKELLIVHPRLATHLVPVEARERDQELGEVVMAAGATLTLRLVQSGDAREKLKVRVMRETEQKYELTKMSSHDVDADQEELVIRNLPKGGTYHVVVEGNEPLERLSRELEIEQDDARATIELEPFTLNVTAKLGGEPLKRANVTLTSRAWRGDLPLDDAGKFTGVLWQKGKQSAFLKAEALGGGLPVKSPELGSDPSEWTIDLPKRVIEGVVLDAESRQPLPGTSMRLETQSGDRTSRQRFYTSVPVDSAGRYVIAAIRDGVYDIEARHGDRVPQRRTVELTTTDESKRIDFALDRGLETRVEVVWADGRPVASAAVLEGVARDGHNPQRMFNTDGAGRLVLRSAPREVRTLFVLPREGSFGVIQVAAPASESETRPVRVVVPMPSGSLRIAARDAGGAAAAGVPLLRYNGEWLPYPVVGRLQKDASEAGVTRFLSLPAGAYEVWVVTPSRDLPTAPPPVAPVRVGLAAGEERVDVTLFRP